MSLNRIAAALPVLENRVTRLARINRGMVILRAASHREAVSREITTRMKTSREVVPQGRKARPLRLRAADQTRNSQGIDPIASATPDSFL
jgi:hypothetical protein